MFCNLIKGIPSKHVKTSHLQIEPELMYNQGHIFSIKRVYLNGLEADHLIYVRYKILPIWKPWVSQTG
jgi:hypothetical protein